MTPFRTDRSSVHARVTGIALTLLLVAAGLIGSAIPAQAVPVFGDDFETGDLSRWTSSTGLAVQQAEVHGGAFAARNTGSTAWASSTLTTPRSDLFSRLWFKPISHSTSYTLMRLKNPTGGNIARVYVTATGALAACNEVTASCVSSKSWILPGDWYSLQLRTLINGPDGQIQVWLDGHLELTLSRTTDLGTVPVGRLEIGNRPTTSSYDVVIDDVAVDTEYMQDPPAPVVPNPAGISRLADNRWWTNGDIRSMVQVGDTLFIGGTFTKVTQAVPNQSGGKSVPVQNLAAIDVEKGSPISSWHPAVNGMVWALEISPSGDQLFVGGKFSQIDGQSRVNLGAVDPVTGAVDPAFDPKAGNTDNDGVRSLLAVNDRLYVGGYFSRIDGQQVNYLAALDDSGHLDPTWTASTDAHVQSLTMAADGQSVFACGRFQNAAGPNGQFAQRWYVARFDVMTGTLDPWFIPTNYLENPNKCWDVVATPDRVIGGFGFTGPNHLSAYSLLTTTNNRLWKLSTSGDVQVIEPFGTDKVVFGGHFRLGGVAGRQVALANTSNGAVDTSFTPLLEPFTYKGAWALAVTGSHVYVGGTWQTVNGSHSRGLTRFPVIGS